MSFASKRSRKDASDTLSFDPDFVSLENMSFLLMLGMLPLEVHDLVLPPARVIMLLTVCQQLRSIIRRPGVRDLLKTQVTVRPKVTYIRGEGLSIQLATLNYLWVSSLHLQNISMRGCFYQISLILKRVRNLRTLDVSDNELSWCDIRWTTIEVVRSTTSLTKLSIGGNREDGALENGIRELCKMSSLHYLDVSRMRLENSTICKMARVLPTASLTTLNLYGNFMSGSNTKRIIEGLTRNTALTSLDLGKNYSSERSSYALAELVVHNTTIKTLCISGMSVLRARPALPARTARTVRISARRAQYVLEEITRANTTLTHLDISRYKFSDDTSADCILALLGGNTPLKVLDLSHCCALPCTVQKVAEAVSQHSTLTVLRLAGNKMKSRYTITALCNLARTCTRLVELDIGTSKMV
jgi:hypothetical protein